MKKIIAENCRNISIYDFSRSKSLRSSDLGMIKWTNSLSNEKNSIGYVINVSDPSNMYLKLSYTITDPLTKESHAIKQKYPIISTSCFFGGKRYWIECSARKNGNYCGRKVAKLYLGAGSNYFACRHCYGLSYQSRIDGYTYIPVDDMEKYEKSMRIKYYNGKPTKKYLRYVKMVNNTRNLILKFLVRRSS